jgi:hypothetical protein
LKNTAFLRNVKIVFFPANCTSQWNQPLDLGIIHASKCSYRKQFIPKTFAMIGGRLLRDASCMKVYVLSAVHLKAEA